MGRLERMLLLAAATEAALLSYAALVAFLTPTTSDEHDVVRAVVLLGLAVPLSWHAVDGVIASRRRTDALVLRILIPNVTLLLACLTHSWLTAASTISLSVALISCAALTMTTGAVLLGRERLGADPGFLSTDDQE